MPHPDYESSGLGPRFVDGGFRAETKDSEEGNPDALGPCGCVDYHYADCDLRTGGGGRNTKADWDGYDFDNDPEWT